MTRCQFSQYNEFEELPPCYNKATWIMKMRCMSFGKPFSKDRDILRICDQCYEWYNPEHEDKIITDYTKREYIQDSIEEGMTYEEAKNEYDSIYDPKLGNTFNRIITFRRFRK